MISVSSKGNFSKTESYLKRANVKNLASGLDSFGKQGVSALSEATPIDSKETANSWKYRIVQSKSQVSIEWYNTNIVDGALIAILIQYGHGTGTGGYVEGRDYINPAMRPIFDKIANDVWKKVNNG